MTAKQLFCFLEFLTFLAHEQTVDYSKKQLVCAVVGGQFQEAGKVIHGIARGGETDEGSTLHLAYGDDGLEEELLTTMG